MNTDFKNGNIGNIEGNNSNVSNDRGDVKKSSKKKRCVPSKYWCFTCNNWTAEWMETLETDFRLLEVDAVVGKEIAPTTGTPHLQGYVEFKKKVRPQEKLGDWAKKTDWRKRKGTRLQAAVYCTKDCDYTIYGNLKIPTPVAKITYDDLRDNQKMIADLFDEPEDPKWGRKIYWFWERKGNWGKSVLATYLVDQKNAIEVSGRATDAKCGIAAYVKEHGEGPPIVIMDVPRTRSVDYISYEAIEAIKNGRFFSSKYESGMVRFNKPHVICFANEPPVKERMSLDRWIIEELK